MRQPSSVVPGPTPHGADASGTLADYPPALIEVTLERVIASNTFRRSQRHRQFLTHIIRAALDGHRDRLKEVIIGIEVFGRALPDYDPRRDPIVRVEAGRIREKLARFYEREGAGESFQIVLPIGNYTPLFVRRTFDAEAAHSTTWHSLAVLPFSNLSENSEDASLALGLADQLIDTIGRVPGLRVVARLSASKARDSGMELKAIGKLLAVDHVIDGSLQRSGSRVRCIAQLSRAKDSVRVWSQRFEHDAERDDDLFDFQDAIADAVLAAVSMLNASPDGPGLSSRSLNGLLPVSTGNREARDLFERARYLAQQRTSEGYEKAIALLQRAVALDSRFAQAFSHLGSAHASRIAINMEPTYPAYLEVEKAARRALDLDPLDGEARSLLAMIAYRIEYRWRDAESMFQEALRLAPNSTLVHSTYAWALVYNGRFDEALRHTTLSRELDPLNLSVRATYAAVAMHARRYDIAIREFNAVLQIDRNHLFSHVVLGVALMTTGDTDLAIEHFDYIGELAPNHFSAGFCKVCAIGLQGRTAEGRQVLEALLERIGDRHYSRTNLAMAQTCLGDLDGAFVSAEYAGATHDLLFVSIPVHILFEPLRADARYLDLLARHGLEPPTATTIVRDQPLLP